jgi:hypothetical protein
MFAPFDPAQDKFRRHALPIFRAVGTTTTRKMGITWQQFLRWDKASIFIHKHF